MSILLNRNVMHWFMVTFILGIAVGAYAESTRFIGRTSQGFHMASRRSTKVRVQLSRDVFFPQMAVQAYSMTVALPPPHDGQNLLSFSSEANTEKFKDLSDPARDLAQQFEQINRPKTPSRFGAKFTMTFELFERRLQAETNRKSAEADADRTNLSPESRSRFLKSDDFFAYDSASFKRWKIDRGLSARRQQTEIQYAKTVFNAIAKEYRYNYDFKQDRSASAVCQSKSTDCGGLSILFVTTLRSEGIPARTLVGHFAKSLSKAMAGKEEPQGTRHVIAEFFAEGVGWVPVDLASAILSPTPDAGKEHFGNQIQPFVTLHFDHQIRFDSKVWGEKTENFLQFPRLWFKGKGPYRDRKISDQWNVRLLEQSISTASESRRRDVSKLPPVHIPVTHIAQEKQLCACASASMILRHFGVEVDQRRIKSISNQMRQRDGTGNANYQGTYFVDLVNGLKEENIADWRRSPFPTDRKGFQEGIMAIYDNLSRGFPVMVDLHIPPGGHTVVVNGVDLKRKLVLLVDPNIPSPGIRRVTFAKFETLWQSITVDRRGMILSNQPIVEN
ncbi:MAG: transglutaminase domain-containing protein [Planctomycetota bacterium]